MKPDTKAQYDVLLPVDAQERCVGYNLRYVRTGGRTYLPSWCMKWRGVTNRSNACGFPQWRKAQSGKGLRICSRGAIMITCTIPHCAGRKRTGLWASTVQGCLPSCMAEKSLKVGQGADTHPCDAGGREAKIMNFQEGKILHGAYPDGWDGCRHRAH